jgi:hypothetical protein
MNNKSTGSVPYFILRLDSIPETGATNNAPISDNNDGVDDIVDSASDRQSLHKTKALFTVPEDLATALIVHPILCCGSSFYFVMDNFFAGTQPNIISDDKNTDHRTRTTSKTTFISTTFDSIDPDNTAYDISLRLSIRIQNIRNTIREEMEKTSDNNDNINNNNIEANILASQKDWAKMFL